MRPPERTAEPIPSASWPPAYRAFAGGQSQTGADRPNERDANQLTACCSRFSAASHWFPGREDGIVDLCGRGSGERLERHVAIAQDRHVEKGDVVSVAVLHHDAVHQVALE